jgi:hypothetical protein
MPKERELEPLQAALLALARYLNAHAGRNPYSIPEYKLALQALAQSIGWAGDWMDTLEQFKA